MPKTSTNRNCSGDQTTIVPSWSTQLLPATLSAARLDDLMFDSVKTEKFLIPKYCPKLSCMLHSKFALALLLLNHHIMEAWFHSGTLLLGKNFCIFLESWNVGDSKPKMKECCGAQCCLEGLLFWHFSGFPFVCCSQGLRMFHRRSESDF